MTSGSTPQPSLQRNLSLRDLVTFGLVFIGPMSPVAVFGVLDAMANGAVSLVYVLATLAMACTAWSFAQMSRVVPHAGSVFAYASEGLSPAVGFIAGWMMLLDYLLIPAVAYLFAGVAMHAIFTAVPTWLFTVVAFAGTTSLNLAGVGVAARMSRAVLAVGLLVLVVFVIAASIVLVEHGPTRAVWSPFVGVAKGATTLSSVAAAISVTVLSFLGFDAIASFAEENAGDARQIGTAIMICLLVAGVCFVLQVFLVALLSATPPVLLAANPGAQDTAFYDISRIAVGDWLSTLLSLNAAIGSAFAGMTGQAAASRLVFGMARDRRLPRRLAEISQERGVPTPALLFVGTLTLCVAVWAAQRDDGLTVLVSIVDVGALTAFALLHASVIGFFVMKHRAPSTWAHSVVPAIGACVMAWVMIDASRVAQLAGIAWLCIGAITLAVAGRAARR